MDNLYDESFFRAIHVETLPEYRHFANTVKKLLGSLKSAIDIGCGNGDLCIELAHLMPKADIVGTDFADAGLDAARRRAASVLGMRRKVRFYKTDLRKEHVPGVVSCELAICIEVAEHLDAQYADALIARICGFSSKYIIFTAAAPGQRGVDHVNCQRLGYWIEKFSAYNLKPAVSLMNRFRKETAQYRVSTWLHDNLLVFVK